MNQSMEPGDLKNSEVRQLRKNWPDALESLFSMLLCKQAYSSVTVKRNVERLVSLYIERNGIIVVHLIKQDLMRQNNGTMDDYPNYLQESFVEFIGGLKSMYGIEGAEEFSDLLLDNPNSYYVRVFKYYFWTIVLGKMKRYQFVNKSHIRFMEVPDNTYSGYINKVELFEQTEKPPLNIGGDTVKQVEIKELAMLSEDAINIIQQFIESDLVNILQYPTIKKYFDFIASLFKEENTNAYKLSLSATLIGNVKNFAFPVNIMPYGLAARIEPLNLNSVQLKAFMFVFWMFVKYAPENLYKVYGETSPWPEKHDFVTPMTKYSSDVLDYSAVYTLLRFEATES